MKRILIFSLAYYPFVGGAEIAVKEITDRLDPSAFSFDMVTLRMDPKLPAQEKIGNITVHRIGDSGSRFGKFWFQLTAARAGAKLHRQQKFDAVWAIMAHSAGVPAALFKSSHPAVPYILTLQEGDPPAYIERLMRPLWPLFVRGFTRADRVQAISTFLGQWARRRGFAGTPEIIPNGVNIEYFSAPVTPEARAVIREEVGASIGDTLLVTSSRLVHKNAVDDIIRALPLLPAIVQLLILGDGPEKNALLELARELDVEGRVYFRGHVNYEDLPPYLRSSDIFVRPSRSEGMGSAFVEAFAAGIPVIATQEGGIADFLFDTKRNPDKAPTGFAVDKDAPAQIAEQVRYIVSHPDEVRRIVERAQALAHEKYDWNIVARDMEEKVFNTV